MEGHRAPLRSPKILCLIGSEVFWLLPDFLPQKNLPEEHAFFRSMPLILGFQAQGVGVLDIKLSVQGPPIQHQGRGVCY